MNLHEELEAAIGHGPALPPPADRLVAGRSALRRRRLVVASGAAAAVVAVVLPVAALAGGSPTSGRDLTPAAPVSAPVATPTEEATSAPAEPEATFDPRIDEVAYADLRTGELMINPEAVVLRRVDDLYPGKKTQSVALDLRLDGKRHWIVLEWDEGGSSASSGGPDDPFYSDWEDFLSTSTSGGGMTSGPGVGSGHDPAARNDRVEPGTVVGLAWAGDAFTASGGTKILEQRADVDLGPSFAAPDETTAAAYVVMDGVEQLVVYRDDGSRPQVIAVLAKGHGESLDGLLAWARQRYGSGEGLL